MIIKAIPSYITNNVFLFLEPELQTLTTSSLINTTVATQKLAKFPIEKQ